MRYEILDGQGAVVNTIVADQAFADLIFPGKWRLASFQDAPPAPAVPRIRATALKVRLTQPERAAYRAAAKNTPAVDDFWDLLNTGGCMFRLDDSTVLAGLALILTPQRVTTVTTDPVKPEELL